MFEVLVVSDLFGMLVAFDRVVLGNASDALCAKKTKWTRDPGVALDHPSRDAPLGTQGKRAYPRLLYVTPSA